MKQSPVVVLRQIHRILDQIGSTLDVPMVMDQVAACLAAAVDAQVVTVVLANPEGPPSVTASFGLARWQQALIESTSTAPEWHFLQRACKHSEAVDWPPIVPAPFCQGHLEPLLVREDFKGVLSLYWSQPTVLVPETRELLACVAHLVTTSVRHAELLIRSTLWQVELEAEVERRTAELRQASHKLERLDAMKGDFISGVTHELRTPITTIKTVARLLQKKPDGPKADHYFKVIEQECHRQLALVEDLLDLAHSQVQPGPLHVSPVQLDELVHECCVPHQTAAEAKGVLFRVQLVQGGLVQSNRRALFQILSNLLGNAVKFTGPAGTVQLRVERGPHQLVLEVQDDGPGIPADHLPYVFDKFYRGDAATQARGTGLGLAIVQQNVEKLGGQVTIDSRPGKGTRFMVALPVEENHAQDLVG